MPAIAGIVAEAGYDRVKDRIRDGDIGYLRALRYIGPVTAFHLAKNLGLDVVKPDRHVVRMARAAGYAPLLRMRSGIAAVVGESVAIIG